MTCHFQRLSGWGRERSFGVGLLSPSWAVPWPLRVPQTTLRTSSLSIAGKVPCPRLSSGATRRPGLTVGERALQDISARDALKLFTKCLSSKSDYSTPCSLKPQHFKNEGTRFHNRTEGEHSWWIRNRSSSSRNRAAVVRAPSSGPHFRRALSSDRRTQGRVITTSFNSRERF